MKKSLNMLLIGLMVLCLGNSTIIAQEGVPDLEKMLTIIQKHNDMSMQEWSVVARETINGVATEKQFLAEADRLRENFPDFQWQISRERDATMIIGNRKDADFEEKVTLTSALVSGAATFLNYEIRGTEGNDYVIEQLNEKIVVARYAIFGEDAIFFTCVKGEISGNIDRVLTTKMEELLLMFKAVEIEGVKEENFISITANSSLFEQSFISEHYNLQLAMRIDGLSQKTSFVFGTPIITFEY